MNIENILIALDPLLGKKIGIHWQYQYGYNGADCWENKYSVGLLKNIDKDKKIIFFDNEIILLENLERIISFETVIEKKALYKVGDKVILSGGEEVTISHISKDKKYFKYHSQKSEKWIIAYEIEDIVVV